MAQEAMWLVSSELTRKGRTPRRLGKPVGASQGQSIPSSTISATSLLSSAPTACLPCSASPSLEKCPRRCLCPGEACQSVQEEGAARGRGLVGDTREAEASTPRGTCPVHLEAPDNPLLALPRPLSYF